MLHVCDILQLPIRSNYNFHTFIFRNSFLKYSGVL
nr:MAG TPA: hypothetical protein [Caudoviricetes sp.]